MEYLGANFFKCDLQMQTPADKGHGIWGDLDTETNPEMAASDYIRRCYKVRLEVIAITDHNFKSESFIPYLRAQAKKLSQEFGYELTIFPGFEFTANVGKGAHVLGIFEPSSDLQQINHILTECGVPIARQNNGNHSPSEKNLKEIIEIIQKKYGGLVILPHSQSESGIFDNNKISEWLIQDQFKNPELLCIEVPKSPSKMSEGWQKLLTNSDDCEPSWKRTRSIACIMSSDTKTLNENSGSDNYIGSKYTWIKMSKPSIKSLRQAFLDHTSRIRRCDEYVDNPISCSKHPRITSIKVSNAHFLDNQEINFSPNLNVIIGGRGAGKSTIIEYLRTVLYQADNFPKKLKDRIDGLKSTLNSDSQVAICYSKPRSQENNWHLESIGGKKPNVTNDNRDHSNISDINEFFAVCILSKGQIEVIADSPAEQCKIIDSLIKNELSNLEAEQQDIKSNLHQITAKLAEEQNLIQLKQKIETQIQEIQFSIQSIECNSDSIKSWSVLRDEKKYVDGLKTISQNITESIKSQLLLLSDEIKKNADVPGCDFFNRCNQNLQNLMRTLSSKIQTALDTFENTSNEIFTGDAFEKWDESFKEQSVNFEGTLKGLQDKGIGSASNMLI